MNKDLLVPILIILLASVVFAVVGNAIAAVWLFIPGMVITGGVYFRTFYRRMPPLERILPLYLLALGIQMLHFAEEYSTGFVGALPRLFGQPPYPETYWVVFNMVAYALFIVGGIALYRSRKMWTIIPLFFILVGVVFNAVAHLLLAVYVGGYFPGLYTALLYIPVGLLLLQRISDTNASRTAA